MLAEERVRACRSWARTGRCRSIPWVVSAADRGSRAAWTLSRARCNNPCKISFAQTWRPVQPPVIILPEPGAVVRFATCNTRDERGDRRQPGGHFGRPLAREGGDPPKIPRSRRHSRSRGGQDRRLVGRAAGTCREALLHACRGACPGLPELGPYRPPPINSVGGERRRSGLAGWWTLSRARCNNPCKISFAQT